MQPEIITEEETAQISMFGQAAGALIHRYIHTRPLHSINTDLFKHAIELSLNVPRRCTLIATPVEPSNTWRGVAHGFKMCVYVSQH